MCFFIGGCTSFCNNFCKLSSNDKRFILEEFDSLEYLENDTNEIFVTIETTFSNSYNKDGGMFYTGDGGYESGASILHLPDSLYWLRIGSSGCNNEGSIILYKKNKSNPISIFIYRKDSINNVSKTILDMKYNNCFIYSDTSDVKELIYVKDYGIVKLEFFNGYILELL